MTKPSENINIAQHGIDFAECECIFDAPLATSEDDRAPYGEQRLRSLDLFNGRVVMLVWTERDGGPHPISCRYGDRREIGKYFKENGF
jgi:uncharacterized DUF497 family protein